MFRCYVDAVMTTLMVVSAWALCEECIAAAEAELLWDATCYNVLINEYSMPTSVTAERQVRERCCAFAESWSSCIQISCTNQTDVRYQLSLACFAFSTKWRIVNADTIPRRWVVWDLQFYEDKDCQIKHDTVVGGATPLPDGHHQTYTAANAFDADSDTEWASECDSCSRGHAAVGLQLQSASTVQCIRMRQSDCDTWGTTRIIVQNYDGFVWRSFGLLSTVACDKMTEDEMRFPGCRLPLVENHFTLIGNALHEGARQQLTCSTSISVYGPNFVPFMCQEGVWSADRPDCPKADGAVRLVLPSTEDAKAYNIKMHEVSFHADARCDGDVVGYVRNFTLVAEGLSGVTTIREASDVMDNDESTYWLPEWQFVTKHVTLAVGVVSDVAIPFRCAAFRYSSTRNWIPLTFTLESWSGMGWVKRAETRVVGGQKQTVTQEGCDELLPPDNRAMVNSSDNLYNLLHIGSKRIVECAPGYSSERKNGVLQTEEVVTCGANGFSAYVLDCVGNCADYFLVPVGFLVRGGDSKIGSIRTVECAPGYEPQNLLVTVTCMRGGWDWNLSILPADRQCTRQINASDDSAMTAHALSRHSLTDPYYTLLALIFL